MKKDKLMMILAFLTSLAFAQDNPFVPPQPIDEAAIFNDFERKDVVFNSDARLLKSISITYVTLDGSEKTISLDINQSLDWHNIYAFVKTKSPQTTPVLDVSVTTPEQFNLAGEKNASLSVEIPNDNGKLDEFISFASYKKKIKFITQDEIIGHFAVGNPSKIIIDFERNVSFKTKNLRLKIGTAFKQLTLGAHKGYYRLVIYLDGKYNYKIQKDDSGYVILLV